MEGQTMIDDEQPGRQRVLSGDEVTGFTGVPAPARVAHEGRFVRLEPLDPDRHGEELWAAASDPAASSSFDYLPYGPWAEREEYLAWLRLIVVPDDPLFFAIRDGASGRAVGLASYLSIEPAHASIEIGHLWFGQALQRTPAATEAIFLLLTHALDDLGYRRMEWKCNALNAASRAAARRFGFTFEGIFYRHRVFKGQNRDTAWYSILDEEWPAIRAAFETWLAPRNFDENGMQRRSLSELTASA